MMIVSAGSGAAFPGKTSSLSPGAAERRRERAVVLGKTAAEVLEKKVGDALQLETEELAVVGIVDGGAGGRKRSVILSCRCSRRSPATKARSTSLTCVSRRGRSRRS